MKIATIEVETCGDCPHVLWANGWVCDNTADAREIENTLEIPDWCPLPDAPKFSASEPPCGDDPLPDAEAPCQ